ncbi:putative CTD small phosphatase-like protein 2 [Melia azedarach]|uniref:CTD small phosphatase-like protein 2 n=1 Tax=Melia azedarach TaxID=155640 RepID=A0ACC1Z2P2_MELAZ|nr:putative CTD small phosphatase-like protein 2 [Melia azedarach]
MEHSMNSYMQHNPVACKPTSDNSPVEEESGWTAYFEDFSSNNNRENSYCSSFCSPSLVSDAASCAAWKLSEKHHLPDCSSIPKKLKFKKTRTEQIWFDDSLEDTASSPVNSPKVSDLKLIDMNPRKTDDHMYSSLGKGVASSELQPKERSINFNIGKNDCADLKRRGLCLVPLSMPFI